MKLATFLKSDYSGGLNSTASLREIAPNEATVLQNWDITYQGQLRRRDGLTIVGAAPASPCTGLGAFIRDAGIDMLRNWSTNLEYLNGASWAKIADYLTAGNRLWMENVQIKGRIYIGNTDNPLQYWDRGATVGTLGSTTFTGSGLNDATYGGNYIGNGQTYVVQIDGTGTPDTFKWSDDGGSTWKATGVHIVAGAITLNHGVTITFAATTGHTSTNHWNITPTGVLTTVASNPPHGNVMIWFNNFMFILNNVKVSSTLYTEDIFWSSLGDPNTYDTTTDHTTVPGDGQLITAVPLGDNLVLFKERSIQYLTGFSNNSFAIASNASSYASASEEVGCLAPYGACQVGNEVWFIDNEANIRRVTRTDFDAFRHDIVSTKIRASLNKINKGQIAKAQMWVWDNKVFCSLPNGTDTVNSIVFVFDILASRRISQSPYFPEEAWTSYTGWNPARAITYPTNITMDMYIGDAVTGAVYKHAGRDDNGIAINAIFEDGNTDYKIPETYKNYFFGYLSAESGSGETDINIDSSMDGNSYVNCGVLSLTSSGSLVGPTGNARCGPTGNARCGGSVEAETRFFYNLNGQIPLAKRIRHRISHNAANQQPNINAFTSHYRPRAIR